MRINKATILAIFFLLFLTGCLQGALNSTPYDGNWMVSYTEPDPTLTASTTTGYVTCSYPAVPITLAYGSGSANQPRTCIYTPDATIPTQTYTEVNNFSISVGISSGGTVSATVNGITLTGVCSGPNGCSAQSSSAVSPATGLSLTR